MYTYALEVISNNLYTYMYVKFLYQAHSLKINNFFYIHLGRIICCIGNYTIMYIKLFSMPYIMYRARYRSISSL